MQRFQPPIKILLFFLSIASNKVEIRREQIHTTIIYVAGFDILNLAYSCVSLSNIYECTEQSMSELAT